MKTGPKLNLIKKHGERGGGVGRVILQLCEAKSDKKKIGEGEAGGGGH